MNAILCFLSFILVFKIVRTELDEYLIESRQQCSAKHNFFSCAKYRSLRYLTTLGNQYGIVENGTSNNAIRLINLGKHYNQEQKIFSQARQLPGDSELTKFLKFGQRQINYYLGSQAVLIDLPEGAEIIQEDISNEMEEGRGKKKKTALLLLPLVMLFKLFKIKLMLAIVLVGLVFIKKAIMLAALVLPSIWQHLKHCGKGHYIHHTPYHHIEEVHDHDDYGALGGGFYGGGGGYGKDYERAYHAYLKQKTK